mmetsp:Transcript_7077/g.17085  ORF Transcript_7077/g.17085 Transcript_7077/m.17085 type:complete len:317 (-) Transcript_7077:2787-3737(-)
MADSSANTKSRTSSFSEGLAASPRAVAAAMASSFVLSTGKSLGKTVDGPQDGGAVSSELSSPAAAAAASSASSVLLSDGTPPPSNDETPRPSDSEWMATRLRAPKLAGRTRAPERGDSIRPSPGAASAMQTTARRWALSRNTMSGRTTRQLFSLPNFFTVPSQRVARVQSASLFHGCPHRCGGGRRWHVRRGRLLVLLGPPTRHRERAAAGRLVAAAQQDPHLQAARAGGDIGRHGALPLRAAERPARARPAHGVARPGGRRRHGVPCVHAHHTRRVRQGLLRPSGEAIPGRRVLRGHPAQPQRPHSRQAHIRQPQ